MNTKHISRAHFIEKVGKVPIVNSFLRWYARRFPEGSIVTIKNGYIVGYKWRRSHRFANGYWLGIYEMSVQDALVHELCPGDIFYDIGSHAGFFSLLGSKLVGSEGHVHAFEPWPCNVEAIKDMISLNNLDNCSVVEAAVCNAVGQIRFSSGNSTSTAHIAHMEKDDETISVRAITLDHFVQTNPPPNVIKMDIEGAEFAALQGANNILRGPTPPKLLLELHGYETAKKVRALLLDVKYQLFSLDHILIKGDTLPHHVLAIPKEQELE